MKTSLRIGTDPEFFLVDKEGNNCSAIGVVTGTKSNRVDLGNGYQLFYDNVLAEMNFPPASHADELVVNVRKGISLIREVVHPLRVYALASGMFTERDCEHPDAKVFGCEPEYCCYSLQQIAPPECQEGNYFRSAGAHIHLGSSTESFPLLSPITVNDESEHYYQQRSVRDFGRVWVVRLLDLFLSVPFVLLECKDVAAKNRRSKLYGKAGTHRPKEAYGVEYRPPSNFWLRNQKTVRLVWNICEWVVGAIENGLHEDLWKDGSAVAYDNDLVQLAVNGLNRDAAISLMEGVIRKHLPSSIVMSIFELCDQPSLPDLAKEWR